MCPVGAFDRLDILGWDFSDVDIARLDVGDLRFALGNDAVLDPVEGRRLALFDPKARALIVSPYFVPGPMGMAYFRYWRHTGVKIDVHDDGTVNIFATDGNSAKRALKMVSDIAAVAEVGKTYLGKVVRIAEFGAFVEIMPGVDGLLHVSEIAMHRVKDVRDELKEGDQLLVKVINVDPASGKVRLSRKAILIEEQGGTYVPNDAGGDRGDRGDRGPRGPRRRDR